MTTTVIATVGSTGTYSTWQSAEDASPTDLTAVDEIYSIQGAAETFTAGAGVVLVSVAGQTTDATRYIELTAQAGHSFQDGIGSGPLRADPAYGCYLTSAQDFKSVVSCATNYTHVNKLMIVSTAGSGSAATLDMGAGASGSAVCDVNACIIEGTRGATTAGVVHMYGSGQVIRNSLVTLLGSAQGAITCLMNGTQAYNCTIAAPSDLATKPTYVNVGAYASPTFQNCALYGATSMYTGGSAPSFITNLTDVASPPAGCTTASYASSFVNTTSATRDFRITGSSPLDSATAQSDPGHAATDILGVTRDQPTDIGAYEFIASNNKSVQATGLALSFTQGAVVPGNEVTVSGLSMTLAQGSVTPSLNGTTTVSVTGLALALTQGAVGTVHIVMPTGLALSLNQGNVSVGNDVTVQASGMGLALGQGRVGTSGPGDVTVFATGMSLTLAQGALQTVHTVSVTGMVIDLQQGTITASGGTQSIWSDVTTPTATWTNAD